MSIVKVDDSEVVLEPVCEPISEALVVPVPSKCAWCRTSLSMLISTARDSLCPRCRTTLDSMIEVWGKL